MNSIEGRRTCLYTPGQLDAIVGDMARQAAGLLTGSTKIAIVGSPVPSWEARLYALWVLGPIAGRRTVLAIAAMAPLLRDGGHAYGAGL